MLLSLKKEGNPDAGCSTDGPRGRDAQRSDPGTEGRMLTPPTPEDIPGGVTSVDTGADGGPGAGAVAEGQ